MKPLLLATRMVLALHPTPAVTALVEARTVRERPGARAPRPQPEDRAA